MQERTFLSKLVQAIRAVLQSPLGRRQLIALIVLVSVPVLLLSVQSYLERREDAGDTTLDQLNSVAITNEALVEEFFLDFETTLNVMLGSSDLQQAMTQLASQPEDVQLRTQVEAGFSAYAGLDLPYTALGFYAPDGVLLAGVGNQSINDPAAQRVDPVFLQGSISINSGSPFYSPTFDDSLIYVAAPVVDTRGDLKGVVFGVGNLDELELVLQQELGIGESEDVYLVSKDGFFLTGGIGQTVAGQTAPSRSSAIEALRNQQSGRGRYDDYRSIDVFGAYRWLSDAQVGVVVEIDSAEVFPPTLDLILQVIPVALLSLIIATGVAIFLTTTFLQPVLSLTAGARRLATGDFSNPIQVRGKNELALLGQTFNDMGSQIEKSLAEMESRVQARTADLSTTLEVGRLATRLATDENLLPQLVNFIRDRFGIYYAQIYLLDDAKRHAILRAGSGEVGQQLVARQYRLDTSEASIVARTVQTRQTVLIGDTATSPVHRLNPLLPETRSEIAIPLMVGSELLGVMDLQATQAGIFNADNLPVFEAMANQIAAVLQSTEAYDEALAAIERADVINRRLTRENWSSYLGGLAYGERLGYLYDLEKPRQLEENRSLPEVVGRDVQAENYYEETIALAGQPIGSLVVAEDRERQWLPEELALIKDVAGRVAQTIEQFRAFDETEAALAQTRALYQASQVLIETQEPAKLLEGFIEPIAKIAPCAASLTYVTNDENGVPDQSVVVATVSLISHKTTVPLGSQMRLDDFALGRFVKENHRDMIAVSDVAKSDLIDPAAREILNSINTQAFLFIPLATATGGLVGTVTIEWTHPYTLPTRYAEMYNVLAPQLASVIESLRLFENIQKRAVELATVAEVSREASGTLEIDDLLARVVDLTKARFNLYHAHIYLIDEAATKLVLAAGAGDVGKRMTEEKRAIAISNRHSVVAQAALERRAVVVNDVTLSPAFLPNPLLPNTRSELAIPMVVGDELIGILDVQASVVNRFSPEDVAVKSTLAAQIAIAIQNARAYQQAEEARKTLDNERRTLDTILRNIPSGIFVVEAPSGRPILTNRRAEELLGRGISSNMATDTIAEVYTAYVYGTDELYPTENLPLVRALYGESISVDDMEIRRPDGHRALIEMTGTPIIDDNQKIIAALVNFQDITERRQAEQEINAARVFAESLSQINSALVQANDENEIIAPVAAVVEPYGVALSFLIYTHTKPETDIIETVEIVALRRGDGQILPTDTIGPTVYRIAEYPLLALIAEAPDRVVYIENAVQDVSIGETTRQAMIAQGFGAAIAIPLRVKGQWQGILSFNWPQPMRFDANLRTLVEASRPNIAAVVASRRAYLAEQEAQAEANLLYQISTAINESQNLQGLVDAIVTYAAPPESLSIALSINDNFENPVFGTIVADWQRSGVSSVGVQFRNSDFPFAQKFDRGAVFVISDIRTDANLDDQSRQAFQQLGIVGLLSAPVVAGKDLIGNLSITTDQPYSFSESTLRIIRAVAEQISVAIQRFNLLQQTQRRAAEMETVAQVSAEASTTLEVSELLQTVVDLTKERFGLYHAHVYLLDADNAMLSLAAGAGEVGQRMVQEGRKISLKQKHSLVALAAQNAKPVVVNDVDASEDFLPNPLLPETRSELAVPMIAGDSVIGVLDVQANVTNRFTQEDIRVQSTLAAQVAIAIQNARSYQQAETARVSLDNQRRTLDAILRSIPSGVFVAEPKELRPILTNRRAEELLGRGISPDAVASNMTEIYAAYLYGTDELYPTDKLPIVRALQGESVTVEDMEIRRPDGGRYLLEVTSAPIYDENEQIVASLVNFQDITERKQAEEALRKQALELATVAELSTSSARSLNINELLQAVVDLTKERFDLYHVHLYLYNPTTDHLVLAAGAGEIGARMVALGHEIPLKNRYSIVARAAREKGGIIVRDTAAEEFFLPNPFLPETRSEMAIPMIVGTELIGVLDTQSARVNRFTQQDLNIKEILADQVAIAIKNARLYSEQVSYVEQLRDLDRLKSEFLASMSHELRTPLNSIIGYAEVMLDGIDGDLTEDMTEDVTAIHSSGRLLLNLINDILDLAKIEAKQMELEYAPIELEGFLQEIVQTSQILVKDKSIKIRTEVDGSFYGNNGNKPVLNADARRIQQIMNNLLSNAAKFTEQGQIVVRASYEDTHVKISVEDSGIGIEEAKLSQVFERFRQVDQSSTRRAGGTGLGLAITKELVEMHGGHIWVESEYGKGTKFNFTLPYDRPLRQDEPYIEATVN